ncbi:glyoxylate/hydroxypyruvate reductase A [Sphingomonas naphthae]|uniref:Glyoxylate/hydroxypyruvate reductase A n=1 Tax=Sphingomonas naphthae TaxID=1813468 RepID=A0ABY7TJ72_9SPHN|nr:glyoxylate/hydroxypyruvate reductase A [Sphingomonas naphthae]WCT73078.1 glyoxylate/hydroxypyruvate reductase A [Sphingomonas naphthae]
MRDILAFYSAVDPFAPWAEALAPLLPDVEISPADAVTDPERVRTALVWKPPPGFFARFPNLALVVNLGAGVDRLVAREDIGDVPITRLSDPEMGRMMANFVLFAVLRHARDIPHFEIAQRQAEWTYRHPRPARDITVAILGLGELGALAAAEVARLGFTVHGWSRSPKRIEGVTTHHGRDTLDTVLAGADILVSLLPLTVETRGLLDADRFAAMKPGAAFVNVSRGQVVDENALIAALFSGRIGSATLDVFAAEPLARDSPLWAMPGVLVTPHLASVALPETAAVQIAENVRRVSAGLPAIGTVSRSRGY